ncbi:gp58-like family protein [Brachyspira hampsonii]|uniref:gp58-like family protein n=1 Tax=Brachyspira hampsonii TaxID=1287055 RepID=UPI000A40BF41|nr:gp58-like family protein [Brachyspira hampsonii]
MKLNDPTVSGSAGDGTFIDKDDRNGITGTLIKPKVFNQLIYETNALIKEGGLIPSNKDLTQIYTAIRNLYTNADNELKNYLDNKISIESSKITEEIKERKEADSNLQNQINTSNLKISQEITDRKNADSNLQSLINTANSKITQEITNRKNAISNVENQIRNINMIIDETSSFIIKETITKSGSGTQSWALTWRSDLEYLQVGGYIGGKNYLASGSFGLFQSINDLAPFIGWAGKYYYGGDFQTTFANWQAGLSNIRWFPILNTKPILAMKNVSNETMTAYLYFLVRKK